MLSNISTRLMARPTGFALQQFRFCSAASSEAVGTAGKVEAGKPAHKNAKQQAKEPKFEWSYVIGIPRYASRKDLEMLLGTFKPTKIEPMLTINHVFSGAYGFKFATPEEHVEFRKTMSSNELNKAKSLSLKVYDDSWYDSKKLLHASAAVVSNRTVRCQVGNQQVTIEHLVSFFEEYDLKHEHIKKFGGTINGAKPHYLLNFRSPEEAERAAIEKNNKPFNRDTISLETYQC